MGDTVDAYADHLQGRPRRAARGRALPRSRRGLAGGRDGAHRRPRRPATAGAAASRSPARACTRSPSRPGPTTSPPGGARSSARSQAGQQDFGGELSEGAALLRAIAERARRRGRRPAAPRRRAPDRRRRAGPRAARRSPSATPTAPPPASWTSRWRSTSTACAPASAPGMSCSRARWGGFAGVADQIPRLAELGFDVLYLPPIHPIGTTNRKGANNALVAQPGDPGQPVGDRLRGGRPRRDQPRAGQRRRLRRAGRHRPRARHRDRAGLRDPVLARPPVAARAPRVVPAPPRRHAEVRREPAQALPGHLQRQLGHAAVARAVAGAAGRRRCTGSTGA